MSCGRPISAGDSSGFSLLEVLLALAITIVVMGLVAQTLGHVSQVFRSQSDVATTSGGAAFAVDDILHELSITGQGLGQGIPSVVPYTKDALALRSNPLVAASWLRANPETEAQDFAAGNADAFEKGDRLLLASARGQHELAEVVSKERAMMTLRSLEAANGELSIPRSAEETIRALGVREVRYFLERGDDARPASLIKDVLGVGRRVLSKDVVSLSFEFLDSDGEPIARGKVATSRELATVRLVVTYETGDRARPTRTIASAVSLHPTSGTVDFERRDVGFRLSRFFYPLDRPVAAGSRIGSPTGIILSSGASPPRDPAYVYSFALEESFTGATVDAIAPLDDVRRPVAMAFGPESGPLAGSLFVAAGGLRIGHLTRILPDSAGVISSESDTLPFEGTEAVAQAGGIAFGVDGALYVTSREKGAIYRFLFDPSGAPQSPERLFALTGTPGPIAEGADGHLYFVMNHGERGSVWKMAFDETLSPVEPMRVAALSGRADAIASDPIDGNLFALVREPIGDYVVLELSRGWIASVLAEPETPPEPPRRAFSLKEWQTRLEAGDVHPREIPFPMQELPLRMSALRTEELDFIAFDALGSLYMGAEEANLVLKFELARPSGRYAVGVAGGVLETGPNGTPEAKLHAWPRSGLSR